MDQDEARVTRPRGLTHREVVGLLRAAGCVFAEDEADLLLAHAGTPVRLAELVEQRVSGLPLEQVLGWAGFAGLRVVVEPGVFVPRRRSEVLVREAVRVLGARSDAVGPVAQGEPTRTAPGASGAATTVRRVHATTGPPPVVVDMCCGTGAVGVAVLARVPGVELHAVDVDPAAVRCARRNVEGTGGHVHEGDLDAPLPRSLLGRVDVLVANAPYVPTDEIAFMPPEAREHEAAVALDGGADGVDVHRRLTAVAPRWLAPHGHLLIETSERQAPLTAEAMTRAGLVPVVVHDDEVDGTVVVGARPRVGGSG